MSFVRLEPFAQPFATHANGLRAGGVIVIAGQVGVNGSDVVPEGMVDQVRQALSNVLAVVAAGGGRPDQIAKLTWFVTSVADYHAGAREIGKAFRDAFDGHLPAMTLIGVTGLIDPRCQVEIEGYAVLD
jgi:enamine deaminase RidA (YjgF/YER057c/UK114 family)